jgi:hypothetical protein
MTAYRRSVIVAGSATRPRLRRRALLIALAAVLLLVTIGAAVVAHEPGRRATTTRSKTTPKPTLVPTRASAIQAAVGALYALSGPAITDRRRFSIAVERLAAPGTADHVRAVFGGTDPEIVAAFRRNPSVLRGAPLGYRVDDYRSGIASIAIWSVAIAGAAGQQPRAQWRTLVVDLAWTTSGWRVTGGAGVDGPSPSTSQPELASQAAGFRTFRYAP